MFQMLQSFFFSAFSIKHTLVHRKYPGRNLRVPKKYSGRNLHQKGAMRRNLQCPGCIARTRAMIPFPVRVCSHARGKCAQCSWTNRQRNLVVRPPNVPGLRCRSYSATHVYQQAHVKENDKISCYSPWERGWKNITITLTNRSTRFLTATEPTPNAIWAALSGVPKHTQAYTGRNRVVPRGLRTQRALSIYETACP
jgi:hypothetical protein